MPTIDQIVASILQELPETNIRISRLDPIWESSVDVETMPVRVTLTGGIDSLAIQGGCRLARDTNELGAELQRLHEVRLKASKDME